MLLLVIQGWVLALLFFTRKQNVIENRLLGGLVSLIAFSSGIEILESELPLITRGLWVFAFAAAKLLIPVFLYLYIRKTVDKTFRIPTYLIIVPMLMSFIFSTVYYFTTSSITFDDYVDSNMSFWFSGMSLIIWVIVLLFSYKVLRESVRGETVNLHFKSWMLPLLIVFGLTIIIDVIDDVNEHFLIVEGLDIFNLVDILLLGVIYFISYKVLSKPHLFYEISSSGIVKRDQPKYVGSGISADRLDEIKQQLEGYMQEKQPFLKGDLTIQEVATALNVSRQYLSQVLSEKMSCNFNDYINRFRVEEFKKRSCDIRYQDYTILALALESGFNSKTTFNTIFKKHTGLTPSRFRKDISS